MATAEKQKAYFKEYHRRTYASRREKLLAYQVEYIARPEKRAQKKESQKRWYVKNRVRLDVRSKQWRSNNLEKARQTANRSAARTRATPEGLLLSRLRSYLRMTIRNRGQKVTKAAKTLTMLGCTRAFFAGWIEAQFTRGMSWYNAHKWDVDHIRPIAAFDHFDPDQQRLCWHYTNLRPMWKIANIKKGDKIVPFPAVNLDLFAKHA